MNKTEQHIHIINLVENWAGSREQAEKLYETVHLPPLSSIAQEAVENNRYEAVINYIEAVGIGGYA